MKAIVRSLALRLLNMGNLKAKGSTKIRNILVIRLNEIGDIVLTIPYVDEIKVSNRLAIGKGLFYCLLWAARKFAKKEFNVSYI